LLINQTIATRTRFGELYNAIPEIREQQTQLYQYIQIKISNLSKEITKNEVYEYFEQIVQSIDRHIENTASTRICDAHYTKACDSGTEEARREH